MWPDSTLLVPNVEGWYDLRVIPAGNAAGTPALVEIATMVERGVMPPDTPIFVATRRTDAPYPDIVVGVPLTVAELQAWRNGDRSVTRDIVEALESAFADFMQQVQENRIE